MYKIPAKTGYKNYERYKVFCIPHLLVPVKSEDDNGKQ